MRPPKLALIVLAGARKLRLDFYDERLSMDLSNVVSCHLPFVNKKKIMLFYDLSAAIGEFRIRHLLPIKDLKWILVVSNTGLVF